MRRPPILIMEKKTETAIVYWGYIGDYGKQNANYSLTPPHHPKSPPKPRPRPDGLGVAARLACERTVFFFFLCGKPVELPRPHARIERTVFSSHVLQMESPSLMPPLDPQTLFFQTVLEAELVRQVALCVKAGLKGWCASNSVCFTSRVAKAVALVLWGHSPASRQRTTDDSNDLPAKVVLPRRTCQHL